MKKYLILFFVCLSSVFVSCDKDGGDIVLPRQKEGYLQLIEAYEQGSLFIGVYQDDKGLQTVRFSTGSLTIPEGGVVLHDCRTAKKAAVSINDAGTMWNVNAQLSGIAYQPQLSDREATLVYGWYDSVTLYLQISNGNLLEFGHGGYSGPEVFSIPSVRINYTGTLDLENYCTGTYVISDPDRHFSEDGTISGSLKIRGRGNSTWGMPKKPVRLKMDAKTKVLGMSSDKDWDLLANYADKSLLRNSLGMEISRIMEFGWTPRHVACEVYFNDVYQGVYDLFEHKETGKSKVDIDPEKDYYLEIEQSLDEPVNFTTSYGVPIQFKNPDNPDADRIAYVKDYFRAFEDALRSNDFSATGYAAYIDIDSWVDNYIIQELAKNIDGNVRKSSFLVLREGGKLEFVHQWDFDLAFGNADYFPCGNGPEGWWVKDYNTQSQKGDGWYQRLSRDKAFVERVKARWKELYPSLQMLDGFIDKTAAELGDAPARNFAKWDILGKPVWPNVEVTGSYQGEIDYLKSFYLKRLDWMDSALEKL